MLKLLSKTEFDNYIWKIKPNNKYGVFRSLADVKENYPDLPYNLIEKYSKEVLNKTLYKYLIEKGIVEENTFENMIKYMKDNGVK